MAEYIDRKKLKKSYYFQTKGGAFPKSELFVKWDDIFDMPTANVVEREKIDKTIEEIEQTLYVDSLIFGELIDFKDGKISADDVIEEFNRVTRKEVLEIIKRNIGEKTNESND